MSVNTNDNNVMLNNRSLDNILYNRGNFLRNSLKLSFLTFNVRGLNDLSKALFIRDFLLEKKISICFLQETHIDSVESIDVLENTFTNFFCFFTVGANKTRGRPY